MHTLPDHRLTPPPQPKRQHDVAVDASGSSAIAEWRATAAHLGGRRPTGLVSEVEGVDRITFGSDGLITSITSFRERWAGEEREEDEEREAAEEEREGAAAQQQQQGAADEGRNV